MKRGLGIVVVLLGALLTAPATSSAAPAAQPLIGAIRWDAWHPKNAASPTHYVTDTLYTKWTSREPEQGWFLYGDGIDTQAATDQEINWAADNGLDYWAYVWYPENNGVIGELMKPYRAYQASAVKSRMKFAMIAQTAWVAELGRAHWRPTYVPQFVEMFKDSQYVRVDGNRPVLYWFGVADLDNPQKGFGQNWPAELQYLRDRTRGQLDANGNPLGDPLLIDVNHNAAKATANQFDGMATYGPAGARPPGSSNCFDPRAQSWTAQAAQDIANLSPQNDLVTVPSPTAVNDARPRMEDPNYPFRDYGYWSQAPTYGQWEKHVQTLYDWASTNPARTTSPPLMLTYAWNELDEGGAGIVPTKQERFKYLDGIRAVKTGRSPGAYVDTYNSDNCGITTTGSGWVRYPGAVTAYDNDLQISWTAGDSATLRVPDASEFTVRFNKGPDRGNVGISIDGGQAQPVNLYASMYQWYDYSTGPLTPGAHTIRLVVRSDRDPRSTGNQVPIDTINVRVQRTAAWEFDLDSQGWSPDYQVTATVSGGILRLTATGDDAQLYNPPFGSATGLGLSAAANHSVQIRMRNNTASTRAVLYFLTDADRTWNGTKSVAVPITPNSDYTTYVVDVAALPAWKGTIRALRLDPGDPSITGGSYDIDWIRTG